MRRQTTLVLAATALAAFSFACVAQAGSLAENQYEGRIEKTQATYFGFDIKKDGGVRRVAKVAAYVPYHCRGNGESARLYGEAKGSLRVNQDGTFSGKLDVTDVLLRGTSIRGTYEIDGELGKAGKAKGRIDARLASHDTKRGLSGLKCYSGGLDWKAKRGAEVEVADR
jgi:hypothetical protein